MNRIFILFPIVDAERQIHAYLKSYITSDEALDRFYRQLADTLSLIDHEQYEGYFDNLVLKPFYHYVRENKGEDAALLLMLQLNDWKDYHLMPGYVPKSLNINGVVLSDDILGACEQCERKPTAVLIWQSLNTSVKSIRILDEKWNNIVLPFLEGDWSKVYGWFVENRTPQRILDSNYKKHGLYSKSGYRGVISPLTCSDEEAVGCLCKAVGEKGKEKRLCYWLKKEHKIIIFFNENLNAPTYHAYEIADTEEKEIAKLGSNTRNKMRRIAEAGF